MLISTPSASVRAATILFSCAISSAFVFPSIRTSFTEARSSCSRPGITSSSSSSSFPESGYHATARRGGEGDDRCGDPELEEALLNAISSSVTSLKTSGERRWSGGGEDDDEKIESLVRRLEASPDSVPRPAVAPQVYGRWRLLYVTSPDTASPIQRRATAEMLLFRRVRIYQDVAVGDDGRLSVRQSIDGPGSKKLSVRVTLDCVASNADYPLPESEIAPRRNDGRILGLFNVLGVSKVGDEARPDPNRPDSRIDFLFDEGEVTFRRPFDGLGNGSSNDLLSVPYPVPFRSEFFRDLRKGWIDVTYLSDRMRISRGNKGTTFVLVKEEEEEEENK